MCPEVGWKFIDILIKAILHYKVANKRFWPDYKCMWPSSKSNNLNDGAIMVLDDVDTDGLGQHSVLM